MLATVVKVLSIVSTSVHHSEIIKTDIARFTWIFASFMKNYSENEQKQRIYGTIYTAKITIICIFQ